MKTKHFSSFLMASAALAIILAAPSALAADKEKVALPVKKEAQAIAPAKAAAAVKEATTAKTTAAAKATTTAKDVAPVKDAPQAKIAPSFSQVGAEPVAPPPPPPPAKESSSFFKKLFGIGKKAEPSRGPAEMRLGTGPEPAPTPAPAAKAGPKPEMPSIGQELSTMEKEVDPKALDAAKDVAKLFNTKDRIKMYLRMPAMMQMPMIDRENPGQMDKIQKSMNDAVEKLADSYIDNAEKNKAIALAKIFTADELDQMEKFYSSSTGKKVIKEYDQITRSDAEFGHRLEMMQGAKIRESVIKEMKKNDLKIPKGME